MFLFKLKTRFNLHTDCSLLNFYEHYKMLFGKIVNIVIVFVIYWKLTCTQNIDFKNLEKISI